MFFWHQSPTLMELSWTNSRKKFSGRNGLFKITRDQLPYSCTVYSSSVFHRARDSNNNFPPWFLGHPRLHRAPGTQNSGFFRRHPGLHRAEHDGTARAADIQVKLYKSVNKFLLICIIFYRNSKIILWIRMRSRPPWERFGVAFWWFRQFLLV